MMIDEDGTSSTDICNKKNIGKSTYWEELTGIQAPDNWSY